MALTLLEGGATLTCLDMLGAHLVYYYYCLANNKAGMRSSTPWLTATRLSYICSCSKAPTSTPKITEVLYNLRVFY